VERRIEEQTASGRTLVREYDANGKLVRITVLPLPKPEPKKRLAFSRKPKEAASAAEKALTADFPPPAPTPAPAAAPPSVPSTEPAAPPPPPAPPAVHIRFPYDPVQPGIDVVVERYEDPAPPRVTLLPRTFVHEPAPAPPALAAVVAPPPEPTPEAPIPTVVHYEEPEPLPEAAAAEAPVFVHEEPPAPPPVPRRFEIVALEEVSEPQPVPEPTPEPVVIAPEPEPAPEPAPEPVPAPPRRYSAEVPDVDQRVDALLARADAPAKRRKRARIPAPVFEPLRREAWEERLDKAISGQ
jgi:hypothetical protein